MKKSDKLARKTRKMIAKNLIVLAVLATVAFAGVVSWFTQHTTATASGVSVVTQVADGLEFYIMPPSDSDQYSAINSRLSDNADYNEDNDLSEDDPGYRRTSWHTSSDGSVLFDPTDQEFKFMESLFLCETTSDGYTFKLPKLMQYDEVAYVDTDQSFDDATANDEYLSFDLYFRSESPHSIVLKYDSSITANSSFVNTAQTYNNASDNPDLKDGAIGAVRMSVLNMESNGTQELLWIPGPHVYYDGVADTLQTGLTSSQYSNKGAAYYTGSAIALRSNEGTNDHAYYVDNGTTRTRYLVTSNQSFDQNNYGADMHGQGQVSYSEILHAGKTLGSTSGDDIVVLTLPQTNHDTANGNDYYYGHIRINLWIEGEDAEARLAFVGGKFSMNLNFKMT